MELEQHSYAIKKWWWLLVASTVVATSSGHIGVSRMPRIYQVTTTVMVGQGLQSAYPNSQDLHISQQLAQTYCEMVAQQPILSGAAETLGLAYVPSAETVNAWLVADCCLPAEVQALAADPRVEVTGYVADPGPYLEAADGFVVPLHAGGGMRVKIVDGWLWGCLSCRRQSAPRGSSFETGKTSSWRNTPRPLPRPRSGC